jgi:hypothetical protein
MLGAAGWPAGRNPSTAPPIRFLAPLGCWGDDVSAAPRGVEDGAAGPDEGLRREVDASHLWSAAAKRRGDGWRYFLYGFRPQPVASFRGPVEEPDAERIGVCCSGGGIRSAAFNLGALQALQARGELARARYLSAVSGGSYIASAFAMVERSWPWAGVDEPVRPEDDRDDPQNGHDDSNPKLLAELPAFAPGSPEEQYLRNRSTYLAPTLLDKVYLIYRLAVRAAPPLLPLTAGPPDLHRCTARTFRCHDAVGHPQRPARP